ncbi:MAG: leucine-rich repeat domain-containing protein [Raineya sp.]|jgi:Leucine-rich repeat (LRR) protein|nr:leucine-rich repeat domain-containing protein [Raineya sp.]
MNQLPPINELECFLGRKIILENSLLSASDLLEYQALQDERKQELLTVLDENIQTKAPILNLSNAPSGSKSYYLWITGKEQVLEGLTEFYWLEEIKLGSYYKTLSGKENLFKPLIQIPPLPKQLKVLSVDGAQLENTQNLSNAPSLEKLKLSISQIESLLDVGKLHDLKYLDLSYNKSFLTDLSPLANLKNLKSLQIKFCDTKNIDALANLTELEELDATYCGISDIKPLKNLKKLHKLNLSRNAITDITILENLVLLKTLDLSDNQISEINVLKKLKIKDLTIKENPIGIIINQTLGKDTKRFPNKKEVENYLKSLV